MFDDVRASRAIRFIELLKHTGDFHGVPFRLLDWQRPIISDVFGTLSERGIRRYRTVYIEIPKKNGKSELVAAIALFHLFNKAEPNGEIYGCAASRKQASIIFNTAVEMILQDPALKKRVRIQDSYKRITNKETGTFYEVLSAESYTKHGYRPSVVLFDELHAQPNRALWDVMTQGSFLARREPLLWVITTAGEDPDRVSIGWEVHEIAQRILTARDAGDNEHDMPSWYPVIYNYEGDDIHNPTNWLKANPSLGVAIQLDDMRELSDKAKLSPANERLFRWLHLNQWVINKLTSWLPLELWDATVGTWSRADLAGERCYMGGDFSTTTDLSSTSLIFPPSRKHRDWRVIWNCWIPEENMQERIKEDHVPYDEWAAASWIYPTPGNQIDYTRIEAQILQDARTYRVVEVPSDQAFATMLLQRLAQKHLTVVDIPQTYDQLTDPLNTIEILLRSRIPVEAPLTASVPLESQSLAQLLEQLIVAKLAEANGDVPAAPAPMMPALTHENNPVARWAFGNASIAKNGSGKIKLVKEHKGRSVDRTKRIDPIAAMVCGMARARFYESQPDLNAVLEKGWGM